MRQEEREPDGGHGAELWAVPSSNPRVGELARGDIIFVAAVVGGRLLPICRAEVARVATLRSCGPRDMIPTRLSTRRSLASRCRG